MVIRLLIVWLISVHSCLLLSQDVVTSPDQVRQVPTWKPPIYANQSALGYGPGAFSVPPDMEERLTFWVDIYSKYTTRQGVIHDSRNLNIIYEPIRFDEIIGYSELNEFQKQRVQEKYIQSKKNIIRDRLLKLQTLLDSIEVYPEPLETTSAFKDLTAEDLRIWKLFESVPGPYKFKLAAEKNRLRFQLGQKDRFEKAIFESHLFLERIEAIFIDYGLPLELTRLPYVESSFNLLARSRVGASGIWQLMRGAALSYLKISQFIDERNDPIKATHAAAKILAANYRSLESWPLAVTAYNHGLYGMIRLTRQLQSRDLSEIIKHNKKMTFGFASENFYASFLAALEVEKNADKYFKNLQLRPKLDLVEVTLARQLPWDQLIKWFEGDPQKAMMANPHVNSSVRQGTHPLPAGTKIYCPRSSEEQIFAYMKQGTRLSKSQPATPSLPISTASASELQDLTNLTQNLSFHRVQRGESLTSIANLYGTSIQFIMKLNDIADPHKIMVNQRLKIPGG